MKIKVKDYNTESITNIKPYEWYKVKISDIYFDTYCNSYAVKIKGIIVKLLKCISALKANFFERLLLRIFNKGII